MHCLFFPNNWETEIQWICWKQKRKRNPRAWSVIEEHWKMNSKWVYALHTCCKRQKCSFHYFYRELKFLIMYFEHLLRTFPFRNFYFARYWWDGEKMKSSNKSVGWLFNNILHIKYIKEIFFQMFIWDWFLYSRFVLNLCCMFRLQRHLCLHIGMLRSLLIIHRRSFDTTN